MKEKDCPLALEKDGRIYCFLDNNPCPMHEDCQACVPRNYQIGLIKEEQRFRDKFRQRKV